MIQFVSVAVPFILLKTGKNGVKIAKIARYFGNDDYFEYVKRKSIKCAEILVPNTIAPEFIVAVAV